MACRNEEHKFCTISIQKALVLASELMRPTFQVLVELAGHFAALRPLSEAGKLFSSVVRAPVYLLQGPP